MLACLAGVGTLPNPVCGDGAVGVLGLLTPSGCLTGEVILGRLGLWLSESSESESSMHSTLPVGSLRGRVRRGWFDWILEVDCDGWELGVLIALKAASSWPLPVRCEAPNPFARNVCNE